MEFETLAIHAGQQPDPTTGAIMTPIYMTSTFTQSSPGVHQGYDYSRAGNPTRHAYEDCLAALEGGTHGFAFSSGCAASTTIMHLLKEGDHVVASDDMYGGSFRLFDQVIKNNGIDFSYVDLRDPEKFKSAIKDNTKMIWMETPTNPMMRLVDIEALCAMANERGIIGVVDNTFMSPYFQKPLNLGAKIVMHSTTKYINGHSDIIGGAAITNDHDIAEKLAFLGKSMGAVQSTFDSYICMRSLKTLPVRMRAHQENAMRIAQMLEQHDKVETVLYPGLESFPQHSLAKKQMSGFGGMMTIYLKGGLKESQTFLESVKVFSLAESLGGVESLIEHPAIMTHASIPAENRKALGIEDNLVRLSVGIENGDDLLWDLQNALEQV